jgi:hypothetical protein
VRTYIPPMSPSVLIEWFMNSRCNVARWCPGGICHRERNTGGFRGVGSSYVRSLLDSTNRRRKFTCVLSSILASWNESHRLIRLSAYLTVTHLAVDVIVLVCLLTALAPIVPCGAGKPPPCSKLVVAKPVWNVLSIIILLTQLCESDNHAVRVRCTNRGDFVVDLSLIVFSYLIHLQDHSRRSYMPEVSSRSLSVPVSHKQDQKRLLSNSEPYSTVELIAVESRSSTRSFSMPEPEIGYGGGMRTYEEAEENEKARLHREMENEGNGFVSSPIPSRSGTPILTPLGLQWRDGDLPPYASPDRP